MADTIIKENERTLTETAGGAVNRPESSGTGQSRSALTDNIGGIRGAARALESELDDMHRESFES